MDNIVALRLPVFIVGIGALSIWRAAKNLAKLKIWDELLGSDLTVGVSEAIQALEFGTSDISDKVLPVKNNSKTKEYSTVVTGTLCYDSEQKLYCIQDFTKFDVLHIPKEAATFVPDFQSKTQVITQKTESNSGIMVTKSNTFKAIRAYTPIVILATMCVDPFQGKVLKINDVHFTGTSLRNLQIKVESEKFANYLLGIFGASLILLSLTTSRTTIARALAAVRLRLKRWLTADEDLNGFEDDQMCIVCYSAPRAILVQPCKHFAYCVDCYAEMNRPNCLVCRNPVHHNEHIKQLPASD